MTPRAEDHRDPADEAVSRLLDRMELEDPPADLRSNVLRAIGTLPESARSGWLESLRAGLRRKLLPPLMPFAAGAVAGALLFALAGEGWRGGREGLPLDGAMAPIPAVGPAAAAGARVDDQSFELGRANVRFEAFRPVSGGGRAVVAVSFTGAEPAVVTIRLAPGAGRVERLLTAPSASAPKTVAAGPPAPEGVEYGADWARIRRAGDGRVEIGLVLEGEGDGSIAITAESGGTSVQGALRTGARVAAGGLK